MSDTELPPNVQVLVKGAIAGMRKAVTDLLDELDAEADDITQMFVCLPRNRLLAAAMEAQGWSKTQIGAAMDAAAAVAP